ncbi:sigma-70 family RNA polymerase sigma factor [Dongia soli]|uniref:Sigma-70 family RNA polymerase sigma factor n=1 Tax=Dongia soli TaxID=600628 RepID=A0ABU5EDM4_9PROT|nr:sigma-70 family RNA polymerase sigma factor [Dongia soli]MDY0884473.1 sigma-70 family RNA polymerase sigma factor [Dongia soli]
MAQVSISGALNSTFLQEAPKAKSSRTATSAADSWGLLLVSGGDANPSIYAKLLKDIRAWLRRFYASRLPLDHIEDAVQETLIAMHERRYSYDAGRPFRPWLIGIASHKRLDHLRASARRAEVELSVDIEDDRNEEAMTSRIALSQLLTTLNPAQREVIHLVKIEGFTIEEASMKTGQSISLVKVNIHRGLAKASQAAKRNPVSVPAK